MVDIVHVYIHLYIEGTATQIYPHVLQHRQTIFVHSYTATQIYACPITRIRVVDIVHLHVYIYILKVPRHELAHVLQHIYTY